MYTHLSNIIYQLEINSSDGISKFIYSIPEFIDLHLTPKPLSTPYLVPSTQRGDIDHSGHP
ncbi:hypothetical protein T4B_2617 [Trichinella pseudospiralis]|uniref:Uncharacterized protein n=1 Tax=Trichinella pseudospiralis TaxID=6337 RepID=A0A0V1J389_TRIPS|nr:hypothetical protein T4B_2617 [Trichinella pseudospiralis]